jgi:hypothetical protein
MMTGVNVGDVFFKRIKSSFLALIDRKNKLIIMHESSNFISTLKNLELLIIDKS